MSSARNAGESAICPVCAQPSAEIVRVERAKAGESAICPVCAQPSAEIVRVECAKYRWIVPFPRNRLRRSCVSSARNAGESAICPMCAQPSVEIVRVECAKCRRECDLSCPRATLCGVECAKRRHWRLSSTSLVRGESGEREDENWRLCSTTLVGGAICGAGS